MGDTVAPEMLVSELETLGGDLRAAWSKKDAWRVAELAQEMEAKAEQLKYAMLGFAAPPAAVTPAA